MLDGVKENRSIHLGSSMGRRAPNRKQNHGKRRMQGRYDVEPRYLDQSQRLPKIRQSRINNKGFFLKELGMGKGPEEKTPFQTRKDGLGSDVIRQFVMESGDPQAMRYYSDLEKFYNRTQKLVHNS